MELSNKKNKKITITGNWMQQSQLLKRMYPTLKNEDLKFVPGKEDDLIEKLQLRLNKSRDEIIHIMKNVGPPEEGFKL